MALVFMTAFAASNLSAAKVCAPTANTVEAMYPVGAIYLSTGDTNPAELFGFGTWERFGNGRALVGVNESETEFSTVSKTGGAKTHKLTVNEMPSHTHIQDSHYHNFDLHATGCTNSGTGPVGSDCYGTYTKSTAKTTASNQNTGGGAAHNNLPPYVTVYIWRRIS
jgi:hypothetical protein